ncbi:ABC transporter transmembrane domain-containing protein [uncultured Desulfobulbus sp.]|uniref:peptidase domain-containing ABC transporter n=1 Tax=uncultured Desulfobulbus sp. TaxID=239745 RepID=UPI0029C6FFFC|nr:ABC transporter transmembrane domain-containing protein [uncultured Desulfobulbus sp.]
MINNLLPSRNLSAFASEFKVNIFHLVLSSLVINLLALAMPIMMLQAYDRILPNYGFGTLTLLVTGVIIAVLLEILLRLTRSYLTAWSGAVFEHTTSCEAMRHILNSSIQAFERQGSGAYLQKMAAISRLRGFYSGQALLTIVDLPFIFIFLYLIWYIAGGLVLVPLTLFVLFCLLAWYVGYCLRQQVQEQDFSGKIRYNFIIETLSHIHTLKGIGLEKFFLRRNDRLQQRISMAHYQVALTTNIAQNFATLFAQIMTVAVVSAGALRVIHGDMGTGGLAACILLSGRIMQPVQRALSLWTRFQSFFIDQQELRDIFALPVAEYNDPRGMQKPEGRVVLDGVDFCYGENAPLLLHNLTLSLNPGDSIAVSGAAGCGKTTLLQLLTGILRPSAGILTVDGVEPHLVNPALLSTHVGYLPEKGAIFYGTIRENLTFFGATIEEDAMTAARFLGIDEAVALLPEGYETMLTDGVTDPIPPGLKQRIAIARVLANKPRVILFDNADRGLDKNGYNLIFSVLGRLKRRTVLIIISDDRNILRLADREYFIVNSTLQETAPTDSKIHGVLPFREFSL